MENKAVNKKNQTIVDEFLKLIKLIEFENNIIDDNKNIKINIFRISSLKKNVNKILKMTNEIKTISDVSNIKGFGKGTIERIQEILDYGFLDENIKMEKKYKKYINLNNVINELTQVIGIGKHFAYDIIKKYKIKSLIELKDKVENNIIKVNEKIHLGLKYAGKYNINIERKYITEIFDFLLLKNQNNNLKIIICGSYRRETTTSSDIDILLCHSDIITKNDLKKTNELFVFLTKLKEYNFIVDDLTSLYVKSKYMGFCKWKNKIYRIDIRLMPSESYYTALLYFTGSYTLNKIMRQKAIDLNYKLNEYGLYKNNKKIIINSEQDIFKKLKMKYLEPSDRGIIQYQ